MDRKQSDLIIPSNPKASYLAHKQEIDEAITKVLMKGRYILDDEVIAFEKEFAGYIGSNEAIGVACGTDAIELALRACGIGNGDTVVTVSHSAVATASAIIMTGAKPIFIDIDPNTFTMDPNQLEDVINNWAGCLPKAIIPVHLYGHPADMVSINHTAKKHGLFVIEDCCQAHGAMIDGRKAGNWGDIGCFSFYPTKNLGAFGDGGICTTSNTKLNEKIRLMREYGWKERYISYEFGTNSRLDELQAAILRIKLKYLDANNQNRSEIAGYYNEHLPNVELIKPYVANNVKHVFHQYVIRHESRDLLQKRLKAFGIITLIHYSKPIHRQQAFSNKEYSPFNLKWTDAICKEILSLPIYPELSKGSLDLVSKVIEEI